MMVFIKKYYLESLFLFRASNSQQCNKKEKEYEKVKIRKMKVIK